MKVMVQMSLDLENPHERVAYDVLTAIPSHGQKEFLVSAILYYTKSPSYLVEVKMDEYLEQLKQLGKVFEGEAYQVLVDHMAALASTRKDLIRSVTDAVADRIADSLSGLDLSKVSKGPKVKKIGSVDVPQDLLDGMLGDFKA
jgi:hypothetical protein